MADQRNQQYQNILVSASIMTTALISVLIQGVLPKNVGPFIVYAYSISNAASLTFLSLTVGLCVQINRRVNRYLYKKSEHDRTILKFAIEQTTKMMKGIQNSDGNRRFFSNLDDHTLNEEWMSHEEELHSWMSSREKIDENMEKLLTRFHTVAPRNGSDNNRPSFETYWDKRCSTLGFFSVLFFYLGSFFMLTAVKNTE